MNSKPRGDTSWAPEGVVQPSPDEWRLVLSHRVAEGAAVTDLITRYTECGISPDQVGQVLVDGGDALYAAAVSGEPDWADRFGGPLGVALLAAEVSALASHLNTRAAGVRSVAVEALLEDYSAITVAAEIGVSRQKIYDIARSGLRGPHLRRIPWSRS